MLLLLFLSLTAFLGNALILIAFHKESSLHPPSKLLLRNLAATDLCVGLISEPLFVTHWISVVNKHWNVCRYVLHASFIAGYILCGVSVATLTAISADRFLALSLKLRYRQVVTLKRTSVPDRYYDCFSVMWFWSHRMTIWYSMIGVSLCLAISIFSHSKIFFTLCHHQNQVQGCVQQPNQTNQINIARYRKAVSTATNYLLLFITLVFIRPL